MLSIQYSAFGVQHSTPSTPHSALRIQHSDSLTSGAVPAAEERGAGGRRRAGVRLVADRLTVPRARAMRVSGWVGGCMAWVA